MSDSKWGDSEWDRVSGIYSERCNPFTILHAYDAIKSVHGQLLKPQQQQKPITMLDVGCGAGAVLLAYFRHFPNGVKGHRIISTDISPGMVKEAEENVNKLNHNKSETRIEYRVEDATNMKSIQDSSIDVVFGIFCISMMPDQSKVLTEVRRVLKPGHGCFVTTMWTDVPKSLTEGFGYSFDDAVSNAAKYFMGEEFENEEYEDNQDNNEDNAGESSEAEDKDKNILYKNGFQSVKYWKAIHSASFYGPRDVFNLIQSNPMIVFSQTKDEELEKKYQLFLKHCYPNLAENDMVLIVTASLITLSSISS